MGSANAHDISLNTVLYPLENAVISGVVAVEVDDDAVVAVSACNLVMIVGGVGDSWKDHDEVMV